MATRNPYVMFTRGLPGSGKSTWARTMLDHPAIPAGQLKLVSLDDLRRTIDGGRAFTGGMGKTDEELVKHVQDQIVTEAVTLGRDVIVHNTHIYAKTPNRVRRLTAIDADHYIVDFTAITADECRRRDTDRDATVGSAVIDKMASQLGHSAAGFRSWRTITPDVAAELLTTDTPAPAVHEQVKPTPGLPWACIVDLDGTLAIHTDRSPYDAAKCGSDRLCHEVAMAATAFPNIVLCSGRHDTHRPQTVEWLRRVASELPPTRRIKLTEAPLFMRAAGDYRPDSIVKRELFFTHIRDRWNIAAVFDDRDSVVRMWRRIGLPTWQVAEGRF